ncbi:MAG: hypothetical protein ACHRHE_03725 [Tepidisphaerales bacterium]
MRRKKWLVVVILVALPIVGRLSWAWHRRAQFVRNLDLVAFSTSLIGMPSVAELRAKSAEADGLGVDLMKEYRNHSDDGHRFQLAYLLLSRESSAYCSFADEHLREIPWPEVRIWRAMQSRERVSKAYGERLLKLVLTSPTSEGQLFAGRWYAEHDDPAKSEAAYLAVIALGPSFDAWDAAASLTRAPGQRSMALQYLLTEVRTEENWEPAAYRLLNALKVRKELEPLVTKEKRSELLAILTSLVARDAPTTMPATRPS